MISPNPVNLYKYLRLRINKIPNNIGRLFYMSYEDGLWDILRKKDVKKGSKILVPEFWCGDVEVNIKAHGYKVVHYPISTSLKVNVREFKSILKKIKPEVVIVFHPFGITSNLSEDTSWVKLLGDNTILIEDCVHRIVDPEKIVFLTGKHLVIDSLRKVIPLQGSVVYGKKEFLDFRPDLINGAWWYSVKVVFYWIMMQLCLSIGKVDNALVYMDKGYALIGDNWEGAGGWLIFNLLNRFIDFDRIRKIKERQVLYYEKNIPKKYRIAYGSKDRGELKGFPLFLNNWEGKKLLFYLKKNNVMTRFELIDSKWSRNDKAIGLPIGPHLKDKDIEFIGLMVKKNLEEFNKPHTSPTS
jgi:hypothetical protein